MFGLGLGCYNDNLGLKMCPSLLPQLVVFLRLDHCWPCWVLRGLLLHVLLLTGAALSTRWVLEGIGCRLTVCVARVCRKGRDTWRQINVWAGVSWSWEAHVRRDVWTWSQRPPDTFTEELKKGDSDDTPPGEAEKCVTHRGRDIFHYFIEQKARNRFLSTCAVIQQLIT